MTGILFYLIGAVLGYIMGLLLLYGGNKKLTLGDLFTTLILAGFSWIGFLMAGIMYCMEHKVFDVVIVEKNKVYPNQEPRRGK